MKDIEGLLCQKVYNHISAFHFFQTVSFSFSFFTVSQRLHTVLL